MCSYYFSSVWVAEWPPLGNSFSLGLPHIPFYLSVISFFGFEGWIWVLIASVPGLCILLTFNIKHFLPEKVNAG